MNVILETDSDRVLERRTMQRIVEGAKREITPVKLPPLAAIDYYVYVDDSITAGVEIKTRKESMERIRSYGGLMLKHRKISELQTLSNLTQVPMIFAFAFENGEGPIMLADAKLLTGLEPVSPPARRNYRGLACDDELVVYLDWDRHLERFI